MLNNVDLSDTLTMIHEKRQKSKDIILKTNAINSVLIEQLLTPLVSDSSAGDAILLISDSDKDISDMHMRNHARRRNYSLIDLARRHVSLHPRRKERQPYLIVGNSQQVIDHLRRDNLNLNKVRNVVIDALNYQSAAAFSAHVSFVFQKFNVIPPTLVVANGNVGALKDILTYLRNPIEIEKKEKGETKMNKTDFSHISKDKRSASRIQGLVKKMVSGESPEELDEYRKLIRRNVSITRRSYLAGYLFKILTEKGSLRNYFSKQTKQTKQTKSQSKNSHSHHRVSRTYPSSDAANNVRCLYMNVGKIHGLTEETLNELVVGTNTVDKDEVESFSILDRFCFINVPVNKAEKLIHALNDIGHFGDKRMTVSYSHR